MLKNILRHLQYGNEDMIYKKHATNRHIVESGDNCQYPFCYFCVCERLDVCVHMHVYADAHLCGSQRSVSYVGLSLDPRAEQFD